MDEDDDPGVEVFSGMEQPPLIKQLKGILAEYPDDGQIIKELVQNAEDAGATQMKILYDGRHINQEADTILTYRKFFKAPSLCFYNNEMFTEDDWHGIRMIYSSVKEEDPLKVGRFGLGFKSVFHITDFPCIISGDRILLINPHEKNSDKVCVTIQLEELVKCKRLDVAEFLESLGGTFGLTAESLHTGMFEGTLFWFPLRESSSELSGTTYDKDKIMDLFKSFQTEAVHSLLFLKSLCSVELHCRGSETKYDLPDGQPFFQVGLEDPDSAVLDERRKFLSSVKSTRGKIPCENIHSVTQPKFKTRLATTEVQDKDESESSWLVVNTFKGGKLSDKLSSLVNDKDLSYSPFVGVAIPLGSCSDTFKGHIFCFLPLPQEKRSLTGLPIHVNGFFAMSQNRRHLKWASADQDTFHMHRDKSIEWNECLINEVLPEAYIHLIDIVIARSNHGGNSSDLVETVYRSIPDIALVNSKWERLVNQVHMGLVQTSCIFVRKRCIWAKPDKLIYTMFDQQTVSKEIKDSVVLVLDKYENVLNTSVSDPIWRFLKAVAAPKDISPPKLQRILKTEDTYRKCLTRRDKLNVLAYITSERSYGLLKDLELLPLEDGSFIEFQQKGSKASPVYICSSEESSLFPGLEKRLISTDISGRILSVLKQLVDLGKYQIETLTIKEIGLLLADTVQMNFGSNDPVVLNRSTQQADFYSWLEQVWIYILRYHAEKVSTFSNLPLLPHLIDGSWDDRDWRTKEIHLYKLTHVFVVKSEEVSDRLTDGVFNALSHLFVKVIPSLPAWIDASKVPGIFHLTHSGIVLLFERLEKLVSGGISNFNKSCASSDREDFVHFLSACKSSLKSGAKTYLQKLELFQRKLSMNGPPEEYAALAPKNRIVNVRPDFPVRFPERMFVACSKSSLDLAKVFGAIEVRDAGMIVCVLQTIQNGGIFSREEVDTFMKWLLLHYSQYASEKKIMDLAGSISFVPTKSDLRKPSDLYDPRDKFLRALFFGENMFPDDPYTRDSCLNALHGLGMKTRHNISGDRLYTTARLIDESVHKGEVNKDILQKATALFVSFEEDSKSLLSFVQETCSMLHTSISHFKCLPHKKDRPKTYPKDLPWAGAEMQLCAPEEMKSTRFANVAGSVIPLVKFKSGQLSQLFGWDSPLEGDVLKTQLQIIKGSYSSASKAKLLTLIADIYREMAERTPDDFRAFLQGSYIWWGDGFCFPNQVTLQKSKFDIDLKPYVYMLPAELECFKSFFDEIGCQKTQSLSLLLDVLRTIDLKHVRDSTSKKHIVRKDLHIVLQILARLFEEKEELNDVQERILFPVHTDDNTKLVLKPLSQCIFCDAQWLQDVATDENEDENVFYVNSEVPAYICEGLGVRSLRQHLMSDTEGFEEWGQSEPLTRRLHNLLKEGYTDGLSVPKELIQNSDDAGASECVFIYDERQNLDAKTHLLDDNMSECQGPALWAYNNALFTDDDMKSITKLSGATKKADTTKIGKFGLGFCAVYNLTDLPSFVSGKNVVIFDPHMKYLSKVLPGKSHGIRINLQKMRNRRMMKRLKNQFKPFQDIQGCDLSVSNKDPYFQGTLFRFPLRTKLQAESSLIKDLCYSKEEVIKLLKQFIEASGNMLLFTQCVKSITVLHIPESGALPSEPELLFSVRKETANQTLDTSVLKICSDMKRNNMLDKRPFKAVQKTDITVECYKAVSLIDGIKTKKTETTWLVSWASGTSRSLQLCNSSTDKGALPLASVAIRVSRNTKNLVPKVLGNIPFGFYNTGHIFCYLPLPERTQLEFHVNGSFAVTSERRSLRTHIEDDKYAFDAEWNDSLIGDAVVNSFVNLLVFFHENRALGIQPLSPDYDFYKFWPLQGTSKTEPIMSCFSRKFYEYVIQKNVPVFKSNQSWIGIRKCLFIGRSLMFDCELGQHILSTVQKFISDDSDTLVVDLPLPYFDELRQARGWKNSCRVLEKDEFFTKIFLPNINDKYWDGKEKTHARNELLIHCLKTPTDLIETTLKMINCIPTQPNGLVRKPQDLVHPDEKLSHLFCNADERFPEKKFASSTILERLVSLGMMQDKLRADLLVDRAETIPLLASTGNYSKAHTRCRYFVEYLASHDDLNKDLLTQIQNVPFLPILPKPAHWPFAWKYDNSARGTQSDNLSGDFIKPKHLFMDNCKDLVACVELVLDSDSLKMKAKDRDIFLRLGVHSVDNVSFETVVEQLLTISSETVTTAADCHSYNGQLILDAIYKFLNAVVSDKPDMADNLSCLLRSKPVIYLGKQFIPGARVVFSMKHDCSPEIFEIGDHSVKKYTNFLNVAGVRQWFEIREVIDILKKKKHQFRDTTVSQEERQLICNLLQYLTEIMMQSCMSYSCLADTLKGDIIAPDINSVLWPTNMLCFDDCDFVRSNEAMKFIHGDISRTVAEHLGVYTKRSKHIENCSVEIPFEQKEELLTRLKGLLEGYPCDLGIMKELVQNADDAGASEIHFVKDYRTHCCDKIFNDSYAEFQGPALCVFNNSCFTQQDLTGIQKLGIGSKRDDPAKTGQYGVGFNAVYNLTDLPSFLTKGPNIQGGETLCIFDPLHKHVKQRVGTRYVDMDAIRTTYPDILTGYNEDVFFSRNEMQEGTIFRFPLRQKESSISDAIITSEKLDIIFASFKYESLEMLLFLKNLTKISVSTIASSGQITEWSVCASLNEEDENKRQSFTAKCKEVAKELKNGNTCVFKQAAFEVGYILNTKDRFGKEAAWYVEQRIGTDDKHIPEKVEHALGDGRLGLLPVGGVAVCIPTTNSSRSSVTLSSEYERHTQRQTSVLYNSRAYCFLPLPGSTGLPMHINAHFVLDHEARRGLWEEDEGFRSDWNFFLLATVIAPAYTAALKFIRSNLFAQDNAYQHTRLSLSETVLQFCSFFPVAKQTHGKYWKHFAHDLLHHIADGEEKLFPVIRTFKGVENDNQHDVIWHAICQKGKTAPVYFVKRGSGCSEKYFLLDLLINIGMVIISASDELQQSLEDSDIPIAFLDPAAVIQYLKSDWFELKGNLPCLVSDTVFGNTRNVNEVLSFCCKVKDLESHIDGLPLLVTNDGRLRCFDKSLKVFCTSYYTLMPKFGSKFVHEKQLNTLSCFGKKKIEPVVEEFHIKEFALLLHSEIDFQLFTGRDAIAKDSINLPFGTEAWISDLWKFIVKDFEAIKSENEVGFYKFLEPLQHCCLVPASKAANDQVLIQISKLFSVLSMDTFASNSHLEQALIKLGLPCLNKSLLTEHTATLLGSSAVHAGSPVSVLTCLKHFRDEIEGKQLDRTDCQAILGYFSDNLQAMSNAVDVQRDWVIQSLKCLPLYFTKDGKIISLDNQQSSVLVLPNEIPRDGLEQWADTTDTVLLKNDYRLKDLYKYLGFTYTESIDVYLEHILEKWSALPNDATIPHLTFIRNSLLGQYNIPKEKQSRMVQMLKKKTLIVDRNIRRKPSDYLNPHNSLFKVMCKEEEFPPTIFWRDDWKCFLELVGVQHKVTAPLFIRFANDVALEGRFGITNAAAKKSEMLAKHLLSQSTEFESDKNAYREISQIKFIVPHKVDSVFTSVHQQHCQSDRFICFANSVSHSFYRLAWSSMPLLIDWADPHHYMYRRKEKEKMLNICHEPPLELVIKHCQNVCDATKTLSEGEQSEQTLDHAGTELLMEEFYSYLQTHGMSSDTTKQKLMHTPIVYIPETKLLVPAHHVIEDISSEQEISPYLLKAPVRYGKYFPLFIYLGAEKRPTYLHYVKVLAKIQDVVKNDQLGEQYLTELGAIRIAVENLLHCLKPLTSSSSAKKEHNVPQGTVLYLPSKEKYMVNASELIVADSGYYEQRLNEESNLKFLVSLKYLKLSYNTTSLRWLPKEIRPKFLSDIVKEEVDTSQMVAVSKGLIATRLEICIQSEYFIGGVLRLLKHFKLRKDDRTTEKEQENVVKRIRNSKVIQVKGLKTYLVLEGKRIDASAELKDCFVPKPETINSTVSLFIYLQTSKTSEKDVMQSIDTHLIAFIRSATEFEIPGEYILKLFQNIKDPSHIDRTLDMLKIKHCDMQENLAFSIFPEPGIYVPVELHHLLNCEFSDFKPFEYHSVAVELEDSGINDACEESCNPIYVYAWIVRPIPSEGKSYLCQQYEVFIGSATIIVPAFKIYKFVRPRRIDLSTSTELVATEILPQQSQDLSLKEVLYSVRHALQEAWKLTDENRRHIIKRLYLRWHPDKNLGNEEFCAKVFRYIKEVISKLEKGIPLDDYDDDQPEQSRAYPDFTSSQFFRFCARMDSRSRSHRTYAQHFYDDERRGGFGQGTRSTCFSHRDSQTQETPDSGEARRWLRQAKVDLRHAAETIEHAKGDPPAYNWICFLCHQSAEKALKAAGFAKDANRVDRETNDLVVLARRLNATLTSIARELADLQREYSNLRYPDAQERSQIPSTMYNREQAVKSHELAKQILDLVSEEYSL